jgi:uncharacterized membrane protein YhhN
MWISALTLAVIVAGSLHLAGAYAGVPTLVYVFKPLTIASVLILAARVSRPVSRRYQVLVLAGLAFSLAGDVFLMLPSDPFVPGLVSFLIGHLFYIAAFRTGVPFRVSPWVWLLFLVYGAAMFILLLPGLGAMALPVLLYIAVILTMAWQAWERWHHLGHTAALLAFLGAVLFVVSDSLLALNRFRVEFAAASALVWLTYVAAQWLIARSVEARQDQAA